LQNTNSNTNGDTVPYGWTRENTTGNNFLGNGGTEVNTTTALYDLDFRNFDPLLARMHQIDPVAAKYASLTPYNFSFNDPVAFNDPSGADPDGRANWTSIVLPDFPPRPMDYGTAGGPAGMFARGGMGSYARPGDARLQWSAVERMFRAAADVNHGKMSIGDFARDHGSKPTEKDISNTFAAMGYNADVEVGEGDAYITFVKPAIVSSWHGTLREQEQFVAIINAKGKAIGSNNFVIFFDREGDAYRYMWENSFDAQGNVLHEMSAFVVRGGVLVQPTSGFLSNGQFLKNGSRESYNYLPLQRNKQTLKGYEVMIGQSQNKNEYTRIIKQIHTHPNEQVFGRYEVKQDLLISTERGWEIILIRTNGFYGLKGDVLGSHNDFFSGKISLIK